MIRLWAAILMALVAACAEPQPETPEATYRAFYQAVLDRDWDRAATFLSADTLDQFRAAGRRLAAFRSVELDPLEYFLHNVKGEGYTPLRSLEVESRAEGSVILKVVAGTCGEDEECSETRVRVVRQGGRWVLAPDVRALRTPAAAETAEPASGG